MGKVFINVCQHDEIDPPSSTPVTAADGRKGQSWSMPHLCSPKAKEEKDKAGHACTVIDIVFHNEVLARCEHPGPLGEQWKAMVSKTAVEMVGKLHELDLDPAYKVLKMKYYGEVGGQGCSTMSWKPKEAFSQERPTEDRRNNEVAAGGCVTSAGDEALPAKPPTSAKRWRTPQHSLVHRGVGELASTWGDSRVESSGRPRELVVKVTLPELSSAADIGLDITERTFELCHEGMGYKLELPLPYAVLSEQGSAKFDKVKKMLVVTLPVKTDAHTHPKWTPKSQGQTEEEAARELREEQEKEAAELRAAEAVAKARKDAELQARMQRAQEEEALKEKRRKEAIARADAEAAGRARQAAAKASHPSQQVRPSSNCTPIDHAEPSPASTASTPVTTTGVESGARVESRSFPTDGSNYVPPLPPPPMSKPTDAEVRAAAKLDAHRTQGTHRSSSDSEWVVVSAGENVTLPTEDANADHGSSTKPTGSVTAAFANDLLYELD